MTATIFFIVLAIVLLGLFASIALRRGKAAPNLADATAALRARAPQQHDEF